MMERISGERVDAIRCEPLDDPPPRTLCRLEGNFEPFAVLLTFQDWPYLRYYADCLKDAAGGSYDEVGFEYDDDEHWPGDEPFEGVRVHIP